MGLCWSFCPTKPIKQHESKVLRDPTMARADSLDTVDHIGFETTDYSRRDREHAWNKALHKLAAEVINVSAFEVSLMEHGDYEEKQKVYESQLNSFRSARTSRSMTVSKQSKSFDIKNLVAKGRISDEDCELISEILTKTIEAIKTGFVIKSVDTFVVEFNPR